MPDTTRRGFIAATAALALSGCGHEQSATPLSAENRKQIQEMGFDASLAPDAVDPAKSVIQLHLHPGGKGADITELAVAPMGITAIYRDGTRKNLDLTFAEIERRPDAQNPLAGATRMHVQIIDPEREHLKLSIHNPEGSARQFAVFIDRQGESGKPSQHKRPNPHILKCEVDVSSVTETTQTTLVAHDARLGGDSRNIEMTVTGLNPAQTAQLLENQESKTTGSRSPLRTQSSTTELRLGTVEFRFRPDSMVHFDMGKESISNAIGKGARSQRTL